MFRKQIILKYIYIYTLNSYKLSIIIYTDLRKYLNTILQEISKNLILIKVCVYIKHNKLYIKQFFIDGKFLNQNEINI